MFNLCTAHHLEGLVVDEAMRQRYLGKRVPNVASQAPTLWRGPDIASGTGIIFRDARLYDFGAS